MPPTRGRASFGKSLLLEQSVPSPECPVSAPLIPMEFRQRQLGCHHHTALLSTRAETSTSGMEVTIVCERSILAASLAPSREMATAGSAAMEGLRLLPCYATFPGLHSTG